VKKPLLRSSSPAYFAGVVQVFAQEVGPDSYPSGVNPLTGLPVDHPENLNRRPLLVKIDNYPPGVRPPVRGDCRPTSLGVSTHGRRDALRGALPRQRPRSRWPGAQRSP